ncbi:nuclear transport factor 2 family protein [candidate division KSB1 bacterium]|nr:nuclear transport factor 2 family protein [candidate division KSB1 bacterium]NIR70012.1 nuclear transport factor 2 family protein [candidate division KSB1 bacterium]NIS24411.1 nuclear transport factor 2 family protein [candidate division KSB1 bacterium]NIT71346.1 nuclear transport factor 2 family protein [candidate division KSB1 bacterium]NIU25026.1 nuclear transport factor 2 family protein [candidate division KSB1 bacterium]
MKKILLLTVLIVLTAVLNAYTQNHNEDAAIESASMDYVEGWYQADAERMAKSLHPDLVKRAVRKLSKSGRPVLADISKTTLVEYTASGGGKDTPKDKLFYEVTILDVYKNMATVKAVSANYVDYLHLTKWDGRWLIVNILWDDRKES